MEKERYKFLYQNLLKGLAWFAVLIVLYIVLKDRVTIRPESWVGQVADNPIAVYSIFTASEIIIGIIPPEVFMAWAAQSGDLSTYVLEIVVFSLISYGAGVLGFWLGRLFNKAVLYRYARRRFFRQYEAFFRRFGGFLVFVAAVTPLPYSAICLLVGSAKYRFRYFLLISLSRFLRFGVYAYLLWQAGSVDLDFI